MGEKIIILGGRSGTSVMARLLEASGLKLWSAGLTEPPGLSKAIWENVHKPEKIRKALSANRNWDVAKCPEFSFCLPLLHELHPDAKYIWMQRPVRERIESHQGLGWDKFISKRLKTHEPIRKFVEDVTDASIKPEKPEYNTGLYFAALDILTVRFFEVSFKNPLVMARYRELNSDFKGTMKVISLKMGLDYSKNKDVWNKIKAKEQQAGRWTG